MRRWKARRSVSPTLNQQAPATRFAAARLSLTRAYGKADVGLNGLKPA
jgi:hypothetical protein